MQLLVCGFVMRLRFCSDEFLWIAREEYEEALQADEEEAVSDEEKILNLDEEDGEAYF